MTTTDYK